MKFRIYENQKLTIELPTLFTRNFRKHKIYFENIISGIQFNDEQYQRKLQFWQKAKIENKFFVNKTIYWAYTWKNPFLKMASCMDKPNI